MISTKVKNIRPGDVIDIDGRRYPVTEIIATWDEGLPVHKITTSASRTFRWLSNAIVTVEQGV